MASRLALSALLVSTLVSAQALVRDPSDVVQDLISDANGFLESSNLTEIPLQDIGGYLPTDIAKLTDGRMGQFDTFELQGTPVVNKTQNVDGSSEYTFDVQVGLSKIYIKYNFHISMAILLKLDGNVTLIPNTNTFRAKGMVSVLKDGSCGAKMTSMAIENFGQFQVTINPDNIPWLSTVSQAILNQVSTSLLPVTNLAINSAVYNPVFQQFFSEFVCKRVSNPSTL